MPSRPWIFVCPSSRGIGLHLMQRLLRTTTLPVLGTFRHADDLSRTKKAILSSTSKSTSSHDEIALSKRLHLLHVDVTDETSIRSAALTARDLFPPHTHHLHLSCAMPGVLRPEKSPAQVDAGASLHMFQVNTVGPLLLAKHFAEFLPRRATEMDGTAAAAAGLPGHATWLFMSARVGSVTDNKTGGWFSYRASKAAVNSLARSLDVALGARSGDKALAMAYHPGTVKTDFSREFWGTVPQGKLFSPEYAVERMMEVVTGLRVSQRGKCLDWKGEVVPP
ncbi:hypothetical protein QQS21_002788 [Conoideocrella luteorostrata]|uniref:Oxidoreductase n=1 Tax=Conoideocrella luteorostrata TaxID=1105319 RepID=A0AAJ0CUH3_9HYPO|nr:hypothetical protein QQS21_002788 [Conoideocrella luteorostrata]